MPVTVLLVRRLFPWNLASHRLMYITYLFKIKVCITVAGTIFNIGSSEGPSVQYLVWQQFFSSLCSYILKQPTC